MDAQSMDAEPVTWWRLFTHYICLDAEQLVQEVEKRGVLYLAGHRKILAAKRRLQEETLSLEEFVAAKQLISQLQEETARILMDFDCLVKFLSDNQAEDVSQRLHWEENCENINSQFKDLHQLSPSINQLVSLTDSNHDTNAASSHGVTSTKVDMGLQKRRALKLS